MSSMDECPEYLKEDLPNNDLRLYLEPGQFQISLNDLMKNPSRIKREITPRVRNDDNVELLDFSKLQNKLKDKLVFNMKLRQMTEISTRNRRSGRFEEDKRRPDKSQQNDPKIPADILKAASKSLKNPIPNPNPASISPRSARKPVQYIPTVPPTHTMKPRSLLHRRLQHIIDIQKGLISDDGRVSVTLPVTEKLPDMIHSDITPPIIISPTQSPEKKNHRLIREKQERMRQKSILTILITSNYMQILIQKIQLHRTLEVFLDSGKGFLHNSSVLMWCQTRLRRQIRQRVKARQLAAYNVLCRFYTRFVRRMRESKKYLCALVVRHFLERVQVRLKIRGYLKSVCKCQQLARSFLACTSARVYALYRIWQRMKRGEKRTQIAVYESVLEMSPMQGESIRSLLKSYRHDHKQKVSKLKGLLRGNEQAFQEVNLQQVKRFLKKPEAPSTSLRNSFALPASESVPSAGYKLEEIEEMHTREISRGAVTTTHSSLASSHPVSSQSHSSTSNQINSSDVVIEREVDHNHLQDSNTLLSNQIIPTGNKENLSNQRIQERRSSSHMNRFRRRSSYHIVGEVDIDIIDLPQLVTAEEQGSNKHEIIMLLYSQTQLLEDLNNIMEYARRKEKDRNRTLIKKRSMHSKEVTDERNIHKSEHRARRLSIDSSRLTDSVHSPRIGLTTSRSTTSNASRSNAAILAAGRLSTRPVSSVPSRQRSSLVGGNTPREILKEKKAVKLKEKVTTKYMRQDINDCLKCIEELFPTKSRSKRRLLGR